MLTIISWVLSAFMLLLALFFFIQVLASTFARKRRLSKDAVKPLSVAFLIPAHNESEVIAETLSSIESQLQENDELVVVADNCSDDTGEIARGFCARVLEREHLTDKGKGYALDYGLEYLKQGSFDVIIMVDADCILDAKARDQLSTQAINTGRPVQALYLMKNLSDSPSIAKKVSEFAWLIKNKVRPQGSLNLGGPCQLMGTGMAFPADLIYKAELASACIVEDMKLGLDLAVEGHAPIFAPEALVVSYFPEDNQTGEGQRSRWIQGHMDMILSYGPKLLKKALTTGDGTRLLMLLDLLVPPLVLFLLGNIVAFVFALLVHWWVGASGLYLSMLSLLLLSGGIGLAWWSEGRAVISAKELCQGLFIALKKVSLYTHFFTNKRKEWNKTSRN